MEIQTSHPLSPEVLKKVFVQQLSILYGAKTYVIDSLPKFIQQATFLDLKDALKEDLEDTKKQLAAVATIFRQIGQSAMTDACIAMDAVVAEASKQVSYNEDDFYASDMTIIFYMNVIEHLQIGACRILKLIAEKADFLDYAQLIKESLDMNRDNARLFKVVAKEYLG